MLIRWFSLQRIWKFNWPPNCRLCSSNHNKECTRMRLATWTAAITVVLHNWRISAPTVRNHLEKAHSAVFMDEAVFTAHGRLYVVSCVWAVCWCQCSESSDPRWCGVMVCVCYGQLTRWHFFMSRDELLKLIVVPFIPDPVSSFWKFNKFLLISKVPVSN